MDRADDEVIGPLVAPRRNPWGPGWTPSRVIEVLEPLVLERRRRRIQSVVTARLDCVTVLMDAPHDPHNGAAVIRSCDAFGISRLHVVLRDEPFLVSPGVTKGTDRWVEVVVHRRVADAVGALTRGGFSLVATHPEGELLPQALRDIERVAIVLGNEHDGLRDTLRGSCRRCVRVPMRGFVESLNVSVAAALVLGAASEGRAGDLDPERKRILYARGLFHSVKRASEVLDATSRR